MRILQLKHCSLGWDFIDPYTPFAFSDASARDASAGLTEMTRTSVRGNALQVMCIMWTD